MDENTLHVAFPAPVPLRDAIDVYLARCDGEPGVSHVPELERLVTEFVDVVLSVYFKGPIEAANSQGAATRFILSAMRVINRAADSLVGRLIRNTTVGEQQALAGYFQKVRKTSRVGLRGYPWSGDGEKLHVFLSPAGEGDKAYGV